MKDLDVLVKVGSTDDPPKIETMVRLSEELLDTKSLRVSWVINNKNLRLIYHQSGQCTLLRVTRKGDL